MPAPRGRPRGSKMPEDHRDKIRNSNILNNLIQHCEGLRDMSQTQVTASLGLLKKCLPDLSAVTVGGDKENPISIAVTWKSPVKESSDDPKAS
jgi:hypothetical protein